MVLLSRFLLLFTLVSCGKKMDKVPRQTQVSVQFEREASEEANDQLMNAIALSEPLLAKEAIRQGADINKANNDGIKPIGVAIQNGSIELVSLLIESGANTFETDERDNNSAHSAVLYKKEKLLYYFLKGGRHAFVTYENKDGLTPLELAINENYVEGVKILLAYNNYRQVQNLDYRKLFLLQKFHNNPKVARLLELNQKLETKENLEQIYKNAIDTEFISGIELLASIQRLPSLSQGENVLAKVVAKAGERFSDHHKKLITKLLRFGLNIEGEKNDSSTPLISAIQNGNLEAVSYILSLGAKTTTVSSQGETALFKAVELMKLKEVKLLITLGAPLEYYYTEENKIYKVKICKTIPETRRSLFRRNNIEAAQNAAKLKELLGCS